MHICAIVIVVTILWLSAVARGLTERIHGTSAFLFGWADSPLNRGLAQRRKEMGWFKKKVPEHPTIRPDMGSPMRQFGVTGMPNFSFYLFIFLNNNLTQIHPLLKKPKQEYKKLSMICSDSVIVIYNQNV